MTNFDNALDAFFNNFFDSKPSGSYPPYDIIQVDDNNYVIELAVAGFKKDELEVSVCNDNKLSIEGTKKMEEKRFFHRGISAKSFRANFIIDRYVEVQKVDLKDGILSVNLVRNTVDRTKKTLEIGES